MEDAEIQKLEQVLEAVGPKRVKTVDVEVEQHDIKQILLAADRLRSKPTLFSQFAVAIAQPKDECFCDNIKALEERCCR